MASFFNTIGDGLDRFHHMLEIETKKVAFFGVDLYFPIDKDRIKKYYPNQAIFITHVLGTTILLHAIISNPYSLPITSYSIAFLTVLTTCKPLFSYAQKHLEAMKEIPNHEKIACILSLPLILTVARITSLSIRTLFGISDFIAVSVLLLWEVCFTLCAPVIIQTHLFDKSSEVDALEVENRIMLLKDDIRMLEQLIEKLLLFTNNHPGFQNLFMDCIDNDPDENPINICIPLVINGHSTEAKLNIKKRDLLYNIESLERYFKRHPELYDYFKMHIEQRPIKFQHETIRFLS